LLPRHLLVRLLLLLLLCCWSLLGRLLLLGESLLVRLLVRLL